MTDAQITVLTDNRAAEGLTAEHGLSLWIEAGGVHILFDAGQSAAFAENAHQLGVDIEQADALVISHGHYDHTGGVPAALTRSQSLEVYAHPEATQPRCSIRGGSAKSVGMPDKTRAALSRLPAGRLIWITRPLLLAEGVGLSGAVPRRTTFEDTGGPFFLDEHGAVPDPLNDDLALWIDTHEGLVVCVGCCHAGLINTLLHIQELNNGRRIRALIGGFHLLNAGRERMEQTLTALKALAPDLIAPCHCTGDAAVEALQAEFGKNVTLGFAGAEYSFASPSI
mgnify:CR=1 FL=1